jgi:2-iminoacetate synthase ThiH
MPEQKIIKCPFCEQGDITTVHIPGMMVSKRAYASSNTKTISYFTGEKYEIVSEKCPNCGKSKKEIEKALKQGKELPNEEVLRRLKEAGLDPSKLK